MISYTVSGRVIECHPMAFVYNGFGEDYSYNLRAEYEDVSKRVLCNKLASIKSSVDGGLSDLESLEQRYQGENKNLIKFLNNSSLKMKDLSLDIQDNKYNIAETTSLCDQAHGSVMDLQKFIENNSAELYSFDKEGDYIMEVALAVTAISGLISIYYAPTSTSYNEKAISIFFSFPVAFALPGALLYELMSFASPLDSIDSTLESMNEVSQLLGKIEEYDS